MRFRFFLFCFSIICFSIICCQNIDAQTISRWSVSSNAFTKIPDVGLGNLEGSGFRSPMKSLPPLDREDHSPKRAAIMSAMLPGLGQIYNEKYWKVGVIYIGGFAMGYGMKRNLDSMRSYQKALNARVDTSSATTDIWYPTLTDAKVTGERDYYRRNRDMLIIGFIGLYALQIIDANVDAHLREFEVNEDLAVKITPDVGFNSFGRLQTGMRVRIFLKG